jgi:hypothetical protein
MRRNHSIARSMSIVAALLLAACASDHPAPIDCDVDCSARPLGRKILPFIAWVKSRPEATQEEFSNRDAMLADDGRRFAARRHDEVDLTSSHLHDIATGIGPEFSDRGALMEQELEFHGDRLREDAHCFFARAWHSLKLLE